MLKMPSVKFDTFDENNRPVPVSDRIEAGAVQDDPTIGFFTDSPLNTPTPTRVFKGYPQFNNTIDDMFSSNDNQNEYTELSALIEDCAPAMVDTTTCAPLPNYEPHETSTTAPINDTHTMLAGLHPNDIDNILNDLCAGGPEFEPKHDQLLRALSHDHDYCEQEWRILSEFLDETSGLLQPSSEDSDMQTTCELVQQQTFFDTNVDLTLYLPKEQQDQVAAATEEEHKVLSPIIDVVDTKMEVDEYDNDDYASERSTPMMSVTNECKYRRRRDNNNAACRRFRARKRQTLTEMRADCEWLTQQNDDLRHEVKRLEQMRNEWKGRLLTLVSAQKE